MKYKVIRNFEYLYPDKLEYITESASAAFSSVGDTFASFQILVSDISGDEIKVFSKAKVYEEIAIPVETNPNIKTPSEHFPERVAPFRVFDCIKPVEASARAENGICALFVSLYIPVGEQIVSGTVEICDNKEKISVPYHITVKGKLPPETLKIVMGYGLKELGCGENAMENCLKLLRYMHQNRLYVPIPYTETDYSEFDGYIEKALSLGYNSFHMNGIGFRKSWTGDRITVFGHDSKSERAKDFLRLLLGKFRKHLREKGWLSGEMFSLGIADEPNEYNAETYIELAKFVKSIIPELKLYDAVSGVAIDGTLDIWIPRSDMYEENREMFEKRRKDGGEIWQYVCLEPRNGYINRFMDIPLLSARYLYWGNYLYNLDGYLHWTVNAYQPSHKPFENSCPEHRNADSISILPPGDDKLIYPDEKGPLMSIRLENQRESAEEYEMLKAISKKNPEIADRICKKVLRSFNDAEYNPAVFADVREELIEIYSIQ